MDDLQPNRLLLYVEVTVHPDRTGNAITVPALAYDGQVLRPLIDYFISRAHDRSLAWMEKVREAAKLFLEYSLVNSPPTGFGELSAPDKARLYMHFRGFASALLLGTFDVETRVDHSGLCWMPNGPAKVNRVVHLLTEYFEWVSRTQDSSTADLFNPRYEGMGHDRLIARAAYEHRRSRALLGHTWNTDVAANGHHLVQSTKGTKVTSAEPPAFPDQHLEHLLFRGFYARGRYNWRDMLITLLLNGAGFRMSEPFHLFVEDVCEDPASPGSALVRIYHPEYGAAPGGWSDAHGTRIVGNRREYVARQFGLKPRTKILGKLHAGWKGGLHEDTKAPYKQAYWFTPDLGRLFWQIWRKYLLQIRSLERHHPWAFVSLTDSVGTPYKVARFEDSHQAAVRRSGLVPSDDADLKALGLTPHGHRHAYGQRLRKAGFDRKMTMLFLHHSAMESQDVYTMPAHSEVLSALTTAAQAMAQTPLASGVADGVLGLGNTTH